MQLFFPETSKNPSEVENPTNTGIDIKNKPK